MKSTWSAGLLILSHRCMRCENVDQAISWAMDRACIPGFGGCGIVTLTRSGRIVAGFFK